MARTLRLILAFAALAASTCAPAQQEGQTVRAEVGKPIQAAIELIKHRRGREALAKAREAQEVGGKTAYETFVVDQVLGQAAAAAGDHASAARAFESAAASSVAGEQQRRQFLAAAAGQYYLVKDYSKTADVAARYLRAGGNDRSVRVLQAQAMYLGGNFSGAAKVLMADIDADELAGRAPGEDQLQLLLSAYDKQNDNAGYTRAMEKLVAYYPKKEYWASVLTGIAARPGFADKLALDLARLKLAAGVMRTASDFVEAAQLSLQEGFPAEAVQIVDQGYAAGLLGAGPEAERHKRLKDLAAKYLAEDKETIAREDSDANKDGKTLFNDGFNYVLHGKAAKGLPMMEKGLKLGTGFRRPEHAKLQMAHAYHLAGQNQRAIQTYRTIQGSDGSGSIARLWVIRLQRNAA